MGKITRSQLIKIDGILPDPDHLPKEAEKVHAALKGWLMTEALRTIAREYDKTTQGWKERPAFPGKYSEPYGTQMELYVYPAGKGVTNWHRVSDGTGPRMLVSGKGIMKFQPGYIPRTMPGGPYGGPAYRFGTWRSARQVGPHKILPRKFSEDVKKQVETKLQAEARAIIAKALK